MCVWNTVSPCGRAGGGGGGGGAFTYSFDEALIDNSRYVVHRRDVASAPSPPSSGWFSRAGSDLRRTRPLRPLGPLSAHRLGGTVSCFVYGVTEEELSVSKKSAPT